MTRTNDPTPISAIIKRNTGYGLTYLSNLQADPARRYDHRLTAPLATLEPCPTCGRTPREPRYFTRKDRSVHSVYAYCPKCETAQRVL